MTVSGHDLIVRLFHAEGRDDVQRISPGFSFRDAVLVELDGREARRVGHSGGDIVITAPRFGIRTIKFENVIK